MKRLLWLTFFSFFGFAISAQEAFVINNYDVQIHVTPDAVIEITETIDLTFSEKRHGIIRKIPYQYFTYGGGAAARAFKSRGNEIRLFITELDVPEWPHETYKDLGYEFVKIGSPGKRVNGAQRYEIRYKVYNGINFFDDHSEIYWNVIGHEWDTQIEKASFTLTWEGALPSGYQPDSFVATGEFGTTGQNATGQLSTDRRSFAGKATAVLQRYEGLTVGLSFPKDFLRAVPVPPQVMAEKFYFKNQEIDIKVNRNGIADITERYTIVPVKKMDRLTRFFNPYIYDQPAGAQDWLGGRRRYLISDVQVQNGRARSGSVVFDLEDLPVGEERTLEIAYKSYGSFHPPTDSSTDVARFAFSPFDRELHEPILSSQVRVILPDGSAEAASLETHIAEADKWERPARVRKLNEQIWVADIGNAADDFLMPGEKLAFQLLVSQAYFTETVNRYDWQLAWLNNRLLFLPVIVFLGLYYLWNRWGRDESFSKMAHYYPPDDVPPSEAGILIDDDLHDRDLLALLPYWGAKGYIEIEEVGTESIWKKDDYIFKLKERLPKGVPAYERTMFEGIFGKTGQPGKEVKLSSLKEKFYKNMVKARQQLNQEIKRKTYYMPYTRGAGAFLVIFGTILGIVGLSSAGLGFLGLEELFTRELGLGLFGTGILSVIFGRIMPKKAPIGLEAYKKLAGFELFVKDAELPRLQSFLNEDPHYFDKTLPYAIVFNHVEKWAKKFEALSAPPPGWYHSPRGQLTTWAFTNNLSSAMRSAGTTFSSRPSSSGSGGSFGGGGGFSGGGFGGGGGSSW